MHTRLTLICKSFWHHCADASSKRVRLGCVARESSNKLPARYAPKVCCWASLNTSPETVWKRSIIGAKEDGHKVRWSLLLDKD